MQKTFVLALLALFGLLALASVALVSNNAQLGAARRLLQVGPLEEARKDAHKDLFGSEDALEDALKELSELYQEGADAAHARDSSSRSSEESSYSTSDRESYGHGKDATKHDRRVPVFEAAREAGADAPIAAMKDAIDEGLDDCEEGNDDDDYPFCETAVTCAALNGVTAHWKWLHLIDSKCQKIMNQFNGGRNKKNFNPEDKKALKTAKEESEENVLPALAAIEAKYRIACDNDVVCKQKMNCYISAALAEEYPDYIKLVRCPYGEWRRTTSDSSDDDDDSSSSSSDSSIKDRHPSSSSSSSSSKHSDDSDDDDSP